MIYRCLFFLLSTFLCLEASAQKNATLYPYWDTAGKYGYCDIHGKVKIQPQWPQVSFFRAGKAFVEPDQNYQEYGVIDTNGNYIIPASWHWDQRWFGWDSTRLNVHDNNHKYGLADSNGHLIIPMLYQEYYDGVSQPYCTNKGPWSRPVLVCKKDGKAGVIDTFGRTLIPFEYDRIFLHNFSYLHNSVQVQKDNKWTLVDTLNHALLDKAYDEVAPNKNDTTGLVVVDKGKSAYLNFPSLHTRIPFRYRYLSMVDTFFIAIDTNNRYGIIDRHGKVLLPVSYSSITTDSAHFYIEKQTQVRLPKGQAGNNIIVTVATNGQSYTMETQRRTYDIHTLRPLSDWQQMPNAFGSRDHWVCGYGSQMARELESWENDRPKVLVDGKYVAQYIRDSVEWFVSHRESHLGYYLLVHGHNIYRAGPEYYAVIDNNADFIVRPTTQQIVSYNPTDSLITVLQDGKYGIVDFHQNLVLPFQHSHLYFGFRWKSKVYAYVKSCPECSSQNIFSADDFSFEDFQARRFPKLDIQSERKGLGFVLNADTQVVNRFPGHEFVSLALPDGRSLTNQAGPCFWVRDSAGYVGIVSPFGTVLYPEISFRYKYCTGAGDGIFFARPGSSTIGTLYNEEGKEIFPGLAVGDIRQAKPRYIKQLHHGATALEGPPVPGIYQVSYWNPARDQQHTFFMTKTGIVFSNMHVAASR